MKAIAAADLFGVTIGEQWGGLGYGDVEASIVLEEIARADVSTPSGASSPTTDRRGASSTSAAMRLKERWLPTVADGRGPHLASASPSPTPARRCRRCAAHSPTTARAAGGSTATRTTRPSATSRRGSSCGVAGPAVPGPRASVRSWSRWTVTGVSVTGRPRRAWACTPPPRPRSPSTTWRSRPTTCSSPAIPATPRPSRSCSATSTTSGAATRRCASARPRARSSTPPATSTTA